MDNGGPVCQNMLEFESGEMFGFQMKTYACRITILISNNIRISRNVEHFGRFCRFKSDRLTVIILCQIRMSCPTLLSSSMSGGAW